MVQSPNQFSTPVTGTSTIERRRLSRLEYAKYFAVAGFVLGSFLGSVGYGLLILLFEMFLRPPLVSPANFGQFGMVFIMATALMSVLGASIGLVPVVGCRVFLPLYTFAVAMIVLTDGEMFTSETWFETPVFALLVVFAVPPVAAVVGSRKFLVR